MKNKKSYIWLMALVLAFVVVSILPGSANAQTKKTKKKVAVKHKAVAKRTTTVVLERPASPPVVYKIARDVDNNKTNDVPVAVRAEPNTDSSLRIPIGPISGGVVNGKATMLAQPIYPPAAKAVGANGAVSVQVLIDEEGNVISAMAVSGHPLLKAAAAEAARRSKFKPTVLSGVPVKISGVIIYNFQ